MLWPQIKSIDCHELSTVLTLFLKFDGKLTHYDSRFKVQFTNLFYIFRVMNGGGGSVSSSFDIHTHERCVYHTIQLYSLQWYFSVLPHWYFQATIWYFYFYFNATIIFFFSTSLNVINHTASDGSSLTAPIRRHYSQWNSLFSFHWILKTLLWTLFRVESKKKPLRNHMITKYSSHHR